MTLLIDSIQVIHSLDEALETFLQQIATKAVEVLALPVPIEISLVLADNGQIKELNRTYRDKDTSTDVLSFPLLELNPTATSVYEGLLQKSIEPDSGEVVLGDIVISVEQARLQAIEYGHSFERELGFLLVHGLLHLLGYDHEGSEEDTRLMRSLEEGILEALLLKRD